MLKTDYFQKNGYIKRTTDENSILTTDKWKTVVEELFARNRIELPNGRIGIKIISPEQLEDMVKKLDEKK